MAIFQFDERGTPRQRAADLGIRIVWRADFEDVSGTHLHPSDIGGAIVSLDWADPPESWRWAGPAWRGGAPPGVRGGVTSLTVAASDPGKVSARWAEVLGPGARLADTTVHLDDGGAGVVVRARGRRTPRRHHRMRLGAASGRRERTTDIGGVQFAVRAV